MKKLTSILLLFISPLVLATPLPEVPLDYTLKINAITTVLGHIGGFLYIIHTSFALIVHFFN